VFRATNQRVLRAFLLLHGLPAEAVEHRDGFAAAYSSATSSRSRASPTRPLSWCFCQAKPYHSWERGLNEHTNGLFRQYFPKGSDLTILSECRCPKRRG
jgi:hypothetical protein